MVVDHGVMDDTDTLHSTTAAVHPSIHIHTVTTLWGPGITGWLITAGA